MKNKTIYILTLLLLLSTSAFAGRYYDAATGRWLSVDSKAHKYPGLSPYNYCLNNPLKNIDPDGKEVGVPVYIGVETAKTGHAFILSIDDKTGAATTWNYGRYDGGVQELKSLGGYNPVGNGVLIKSEGNAALQYVSDEMKKGATLYEMQNTSPEKVNAFYQNMYDNSSQPSVTHPENGKVIDTYAAPTNTCVTKTIQGVVAGGGTVPLVPTVIPNASGGVNVNVPPLTPQQLKDALDLTSKPKNQ